jgi:hypothetical protein
MPCRLTRLPNGVRALVCGAAPRRERCAYCAGPANRLCDFPVLRRDKTDTCSRHICDRCTTETKGGLDLCRAHAPMWDLEADEPRVGPGAGAATQAVKHG